MKEVLKNHSVKIQMGTIAAILIFLMTSTWQLAAMANRVESGQNELDDRITHLGDKYVTIREDVTKIETQETNIMVRLATLEAILTRIELTQKEVLNRLND